MLIFRKHPPTTFPLQSVLTQDVYRQATRNSHREWQYHMLHVYNCMLLKMSTWGSKHVEENSILWINNNQCIKLVVNIKRLCLFLKALSDFTISSFQRRVVLSFVACYAVPYFSILSDICHDFRRNFIDHKINVSIFPTTFPRTFLIIRKTQRGIIDLCSCSYKVPYLSYTYFNQT